MVRDSARRSAAVAAVGGGPVPPLVEAAAAAATAAAEEKAEVRRDEGVEVEGGGGPEGEGEFDSWGETLWVAVVGGGLDVVSLLWREAEEEVEEEVVAEMRN